MRFSGTVAYDGCRQTVMKAHDLLHGELLHEVTPRARLRWTRLMSRERFRLRRFDQQGVRTRHGRVHSGAARTIARNAVAAGEAEVRDGQHEGRFAEASRR
jgi:hypothetical protein